MRSIDFLSPSPKVFIFQNKANHTSWGGFFFLIYMIIMLVISFIYIFEHFSNEAYQIQYALIDNFYSSDKSQYIKDDEYYYPNLNFSFEIFEKIGTELNSLNESFLLYDMASNEFIDRNFSIMEKNVTKFEIGIVYDCYKNNCWEHLEEDKTFLIDMRYKGFTLDHQRDSKPIYIDNDNDNCIRFRFKFSFGQTLFRELNWNIIKYKKEESILLSFKKFFCGEKDEDVGGFIDYYDSYNVSGSLNFEKNNKTYRVLSVLDLDEIGQKITIYKRKKNTLLDVAAKIGALFSTFNFVFAKCFEYYSNSFDNYKIVENILTKQKKIIMKRIKIKI